MKKFLIICFLYVFCLTVTEIRADWFSSTTNYSVPSHVVKYLNSPSSMDEPVYDPFHANYGQECEPEIDCVRPTFWNRMQLYGWVEGGFYVNSHGNKSRHVKTLARDGRSEDFPVPTSGNSTQLGNVRSTDPMLNQLWLGLKRDLDTRHGFDWGFKTDFLFGTDAWLGQSYGDASFDYRGHSRDYYVSVPQVYGTLGYKNLSVKVGKFETLLGVEQLEAARTTFYSRSNLFYAEPQTHSGVLAEYRCKQNLWFSFGYVQGSDNSFRNEFGDHGFLGGVYWRPVSTISVWYSVYAADLGNGRYRNGEIHPGGTMFQQTFAVNWNITPRWFYTFQWDFGNRNGGRGATNATYFGTAHYLAFQINQYWKVGLRVDQIHGNQWMGNSGFARPLTGNYTGDLYSVTLGVNWTPYKRISIRPELRYDYAEDSHIFDGGRKQDQFSAGCGFVYLF